MFLFDYLGCLNSFFEDLEDLLFVLVLAEFLVSKLFVCNVLQSFEAILYMQEHRWRLGV